MFAGFLGLTILGDCVSAASIFWVQLPHGSSFMAFSPSNVFRSLRLIPNYNHLTVVLSKGSRLMRHRLEGSVYDLA